MARAARPGPDRLACGAGAVVLRRAWRCRTAARLPGVRAGVLPALPRPPGAVRAETSASSVWRACSPQCACYPSASLFAPHRTSIPSIADWTTSVKHPIAARLILPSSNKERRFIPRMNHSAFCDFILILAKVVKHIMAHEPIMWPSISQGVAATFGNAFFTGLRASVAILLGRKSRRPRSCSLQLT